MVVSVFFQIPEVALLLLLHHLNFPVLSSYRLRISSVEEIGILGDLPNFVAFNKGERIFDHRLDLMLMSLLGWRGSYMPSISITRVG
jgi:hypothetical protein